MPAVCFGCGPPCGLPCAGRTVDADNDHIVSVTGCVGCCDTRNSLRRFNPGLVRFMCTHRLVLHRRPVHPVSTVNPVRLPDQGPTTRPAVANDSCLSTVPSPVGRSLVAG